MLFRQRGEQGVQQRRHVVFLHAVPHVYRHDAHGRHTLLFSIKKNRALAFRSFRTFGRSGFPVVPDTSVVPHISADSVPESLREL
jgi:hypothetical protein